MDTGSIRLVNLLLRNLESQGKVDQKLRARMLGFLLGNSQISEADSIPVVQKLLGSNPLETILLLWKENQFLFVGARGVGLESIRKQLFEIVLKNPSSLSEKSAKGRTILHEVYSTGHLNLTRTKEDGDKLLAQFEAALRANPQAISIKDSEGNNCFHVLSGAAYNASQLEKLMDISVVGLNETNEKGETPLYNLLHHSGNTLLTLDSVKKMVEKGADPLISSSQTGSALNYIKKLHWVLAQKMFPLFLNSPLDSAKKEIVKNAIKEAEVNHKAEVEEKKNRRKEKNKKLAEKLKEVNERFKKSKNLMKRAGSIGHVVDPNAKKQEYDIPIIDKVDGLWEVLVEGNVVWDVIANYTDITAFIHGTNKYMKQQLVVCKEQPKRNKMGIMIPYMGDKYTVIWIQGNVGDYNQPRHRRDSFPTLEEAKKDFEDRFLEFTGNEWKDKDSFVAKEGHYRIINKVYDVKVSKETQEADLKSKKLDKKVLDLMITISDLTMIRKAMEDAGVDWEQMPMGRLDTSALDKGFETLKKMETKLLEIESLSKTKGVRRKESQTKIKELTNALKADTNELFMIVPQTTSGVSHRNIDTLDQLREQIRKLEGFKDLGTAVDLITAPPGISSGTSRIDAIAEGICTDISAVEPNTELWNKIQDWVKKSSAATNLKGLFKIGRFEEGDRFEPWRQERDVETSTSRPSNLLLFHGTKTPNVLGILRHGLKIAPASAPVSGYMFGKGIYFADTFAKSQGYCGGYRYARQNYYYGQQQPERDDGNYMFICEVALGETYDLTTSEYIEQLPQGKGSTKGVGKNAPIDNSITIMKNGVGCPNGTIAQSEVQIAYLNYNEFIVYDSSRVKIKYLIKF
eukprot:TRINITY_DN2833_c0_g1_i1.p1 TRINITY_DN2833_c0_g1~~TRINITY_DN2833_c0_g1_i1.p1  ORF type:complete len:856 (-),score=378.26 TRINITY_DN2833_c0_g1_i1:53-2620(-)